jgi:hypothetical protein
VVSTRLPGAAGLVGKEPVPFGLRELFMAVCHYAYNPVFWYMQQLILLILLAPVLFWVLKSSLRGSLLFLFLLWFLWGSRILPILNADALLYYGTGAFTALHRDSWGSFAEKKPDAASAGKQAALLGALCLGVYLMGREGGILNCRSLYIVLLRLFGVAWAGLLIKLAPLPEAKEWMKHNFFLYAIHFAWVRLINKAAARLLPLTAATAFGIFLVMPVLILLISTCLVKVMERFCPRVYEVLAGGR